MLLSFKAAVRVTWIGILEVSVNSWLLSYPENLCFFLNLDGRFEERTLNPRPRKW